MKSVIPNRFNAGMPMSPLQKQLASEAAMAFNILMQKGEWPIKDALYALYWHDDEKEFSVEVYSQNSPENRKRYKAKDLISRINKQWKGAQLHAVDETEIG